MKQYIKIKIQSILRWVVTPRGLVVVTILVTLVIGSAILLSQRTGNDQNLPTTSSDIDAQIRSDSAADDFAASEAALAKAPKTEEFETLRITLYRTKGDNTAALSIYERLIAKEGLNQGLAVGAAMTAEAAGNNEKAIEYYKKARQLVEASNSPIKESDLAGFDDTIERLGGQR